MGILQQDMTRPGERKPARRRGVVLIAVLIVVVLLSLAAYQFGDLMLAEYKTSNSAHRNIQARAFADSGIHFAAAVLSNSDNITNILNGNPWNNPQVFRGKSVSGDGDTGRFTLIAPPDPDDTSGTAGNRYGVSDEGAKINLNALMKIDSSGQLAHDMLMKLPNMTEEIANSIIDWMDPDSDARTGGAENDYYSGLSPPYRCKNGPIDSIDELLLVKGVTSDLLYGADLNRNGVQDADESADLGFDRGWSAFLTVHSREQNRDNEGNAYIYLNNADLSQLSQALAADIGDNMAKFIAMYRQYGPSSSTGKSQSMLGSISAILGGGGGGGTPNSQSKTVTGDLSSYTVNFTKQGKNTINSIFDLVNVKVSIDSRDPKTGKTITTSYSSPLNDASQQRDLLPKLFALTTLVEESEIPARININTAPREVVLTIPELTENDVDKILSLRPKMSASDAPAEIFHSPAWLLTEAQLSLTTLRKLDKYLSTRSQVYRVQSVGYFDGKGPAARVEAVIDVNGGRPRIVMWRNLTELGKGWTDTNP